MLELKKTQIQPGAGTNTIKRLLLGLVLGAAVIFQCHQASAKLPAEGLRYTLKATLTNTLVEPTARGTVSGNLSSKGSVETQLLRISVSKLTPNTGYSLRAFVGDGSVDTVVTNFTTDAHGSFSVSYWKKTAGTSRGPGLADQLDPISNIVGYAVLNGSSVVVLHALILTPVNITYSVNRNLANTGLETNAIGSHILNRNLTSTPFQVSASRLIPGTTYHVGIHGVPLATAPSDSQGRLRVTETPVGSAD